MICTVIFCLVFTAPAKWRIELRAKIGQYRNRYFIIWINFELGNLYALCDFLILITRVVIVFENFSLWEHSLLSLPCMWILFLTPHVDIEAKCWHKNTYAQNNFLAKISTLSNIEYLVSFRDSLQVTSHFITLSLSGNLSFLVNENL